MIHIAARDAALYLRNAWRQPVRRPVIPNHSMKITETIKIWARQIKRDGVTLWFACRHPRTPRVAKALCVFVVAYALSPIDLIPDFIPVLGYVDDALLLPGLIWLAVRLIPEDVLDACRQQATAWLEEQKRKPTSYFGAALIVGAWLLGAYAIWHWAAR